MAQNLKSELLLQFLCQDFHMLRMYSPYHAQKICWDGFLILGPDQGPEMTQIQFFARISICSQCTHLNIPTKYCWARFLFLGPVSGLGARNGPEMTQIQFFARISICSQCTHLNIPTKYCWARFLILGPVSGLGARKAQIQFFGQDFHMLTMYSP